MTNSPANRGSQGMIPGDEQIDQMLREFFRDEIPASLASGPFAESQSTPVTQLTIVAQQRTDAPHSSGSRRMLTVTVITSLAACLLAAVALLPDRSNGVSSKNSTAVIPETETTMPVSSDGQTQSHPVGDNNLSIEEVDSIDIKSPPRN